MNPLFVQRTFCTVTNRGGRLIKPEINCHPTPQVCKNYQQEFDQLMLQAEARDQRIFRRVKYFGFFSLGWMSNRWFNRS
jgi:hypothetical protein